MSFVMSQKLVFSIAKMIFNVTINGFLLSQIVSFLMLQKKKKIFNVAKYELL